jgi:TatD DNase family protein
MIDTHTHIDGEEFNEDREQVILRAKEAGVEKLFIPAIDMKSVDTVLQTCRKFPNYAYPMIGLHPEEVRADWQEQLAPMRKLLEQPNQPFIAIGEVGLDYYWSREFEHEQLLAFEEQVRWAIEFNLPLMIHCRKGQNEMVNLLRRYEKDLLRGGVFHCFTGNETEAQQLLSFPRFVLGIGGVLTFKKSHLPEVLPQVVPLNRIVLETDSPYMAPVPMRGKRNESAFVPYVLQKLAECYGVSEQEADSITTATALRLFGME